VIEHHPGHPRRQNYDTSFVSLGLAKNQLATHVRVGPLHVDFGFAAAVGLDVTDPQRGCFAPAASRVGEEPNEHPGTVVSLGGRVGECLHLEVIDKELSPSPHGWFVGCVELVDRVAGDHLVLHRSPHHGAEHLQCRAPHETYLRATL